MSQTEAPSKQTKMSKRRAARLAAVQALYDMEIANHTSLQAIDSFHARGNTADLDGERLSADGSFFTELVQGVIAARSDMDALISGAIDTGRQVESLETLLRAVLRAAAYELARRDDIDAPVVISEYLTVTAAFYDKAETRFVNGVLDRMAKVLRDDD